MKTFVLHFSNELSMCTGEFFSITQLPLPSKIAFHPVTKPFFPDFFYIPKYSHFQYHIKWNNAKLLYYTFETSYPCVLETSFQSLSQLPLPSKIAFHPATKQFLSDFFYIPKYSHFTYRLLLQAKHQNRTLAGLFQWSIKHMWRDTLELILF